MVTENTLENLDKELVQKSKEEIKKDINYFLFLIVFGFLLGGLGAGFLLGTYLPANKVNSFFVCPEGFADFNGANVLDKNTFVQGINALYQVNNEEHQVIWSGIQDLNKQLNENGVEQK